MRVAHFIDRLKRPGGAEALLLTVADAMRSIQVEVIVVTLRENDPAISAELAASGAWVTAFPSKRVVDPVRLARMVRFIREERFDVIHTHLTGATVVGALAGRACAVPVVSTLHNTTLASQKHFYHGRLENWLLKHAVSEVIAVGNSVAAAHRDRIGNKPITVVPNAVRAVTALGERERRAVRQELIGCFDGCLLITAARLEPQKGLLDLLQAFSLLRRRRDNVRLVIAGTGGMAAVLQSQIGMLGLAEAVYLVGLRNDVPRLLAASDVYVNASRWEGLPVAVLEAMSASLAVVATNVGDLPGLLTGGAGVLVPPEDPEALADALTSVVSNPDLRQSLGEAARLRVKAEYGAVAWAERLRSVYELAITKRAPLFSATAASAASR
jgi:glycosyltransferase involved in cell wall biosynthesis